MSFSDAIVHVYTHYADFSGRASRSEFWYFTLFQFLADFPLLFLSHRLFFLWRCLVFLPSLAVACRRLHDTGRSGLYLFVGLIPLVGWLLVILWLAEPSQYAGAYLVSPGRPFRDSFPVARGSHYVCCLSGPMQGQRFRLGTKGMTFGRNPGCTVRFPGGTPGISNYHCRLTLRNGQLLLEDLNASYGTFLADGTRLPPNYPHPVSLHTRFYLGTGANSFEITV